MITGELLDAMPPADVEAEACVIGSIFLLPDIIDEVSLLVSPSDFYDEQLQRIYRHLVDMLAAGKRIDSKLFAAHVKKSGGIVGNLTDEQRLNPKSVEITRLAESMQSVPTAANAPYYAGLVREYAIRRELKNAGTSIVATAQLEEDAGEALDRCEQMILDIRDKRGSLTSNVQDIGAILVEAMAEIDQRGKSTTPWLSTGFTDLDRLMGFRKGELTVLAARPSMGKSALAMQFALNAALLHNSVLFFSLEMHQESVAERMLSSHADVDGHRLRSGNLTQDDRAAIVEAAAEISGAKLHVDDSPLQNMQSIAAVCRRQKRKHGLALVVVDYLQLINADNARDSREQQVAKISKRLKALARELEVPVLVLAQLNRQSETTRDNKPRLAHLRESGAIEQDADVVAFVHRPEYYATDPAERESLAGQAEVHVEKNRNGRTGVVKLVWCGSTVTFKARAPENYDHSFDEFNQAEAY